MKTYLLRHTNYLDFFSHQSGRGGIGVAGECEYRYHET